VADTTLIIAYMGNETVTVYKTRRPVYISADDNVQLVHIRDNVNRVTESKVSGMK
jgi:serine protease inhibitor ecotin